MKRPTQCRWILSTVLVALSRPLLVPLASDPVHCRLGMASAQAAEYQGKNIDGQLFEATAYSYETGGVFDIQVRFRKRRATMIFVNGGQQTLRLHSAVIVDPQRIEGVHRGFLTIGGLFSIGVADDSSGNTQPPRPRPLEGFWRISLKDVSSIAREF